MNKAITVNKLIIILFILLCVDAIGQRQKESKSLKLFNKGMDFYTNGNLDSSLAIWQNMVTNKIGIESDLYGNAFFNIPTIYWQKKDYQKAKEWYLKILDSDLKDNVQTVNIMEPHTNYKHKSALSLAGLYDLDSNYIEALNWLYKADTLYRYWGYEGSSTSISKNQAYLLKLKVDALLKLNQRDKAVRAILTELICSNNLGYFFSHSEKNLLKLIDKKSFKKEFDLALDLLEIHQIDTNKWTANFTFQNVPYAIPISNMYPDDVPHYWMMHFIGKNQNPDKKSIVEYIQNRSFYTTLSN
ncbi:MAG: hypothetical protein ACRCVT_02960 [Leadbetterella sp.]